MSCGHDGCTCGGPTPDTPDAPNAAPPAFESGTRERPDGCCGGHDHTEREHDCRHDHEEQLA